MSEVKIEALSDDDLEEVSGGYRGRGGDICTCPYCGCAVSACELNNHIYSNHTTDAYHEGDN